MGKMKLEMKGVTYIHLTSSHFAHIISVDKLDLG